MSKEKKVKNIKIEEKKDIDETENKIAEEKKEVVKEEVKEKNLYFGPSKMLVLSIKDVEINGKVVKEVKLMDGTTTLVPTNELKYKLTEE